MTDRLPKRLRKEPLLDAVFECRFTSQFPVSNMLPGVLFAEFEGEKKLERLPHSNIPEAVRNTDPGLEYAPLVRIRLQNYNLLIGDRSIAIACNLPYKGWQDFKPIIIKVISVLKKSNLVDKVTRYSTKYIDLIQSTNPSEQVKLANLSLRVGKHNLNDESYQVRMDIPVDGFINVVQIISAAKVVLIDNSEREGVIIDIDTIKNTDGISIEQLERELDDALENIHIVNKAAFFDCLTEDTLNQLEPEYE